MFESLLEAVRGEASGERALGTVRVLAGHHRIQNTQGYAAAARWMADALRAADLAPEWHETPGDGSTRAIGVLMPRGWECRHATATLVGEAAPLCDFATAPLSLIQRSSSAAGTFPLVAIDDGRSPPDYGSADLAGRVVLTSAPAHDALREAVQRRGAAGLLCDGRRLVPPVRGHDDDVDALPYTSFWWREGMPRGWGFVVSPAEGRRLRVRLSNGERLALEVTIEAREYAAPLELLTASIPGESDEEVLVLSHLCHPMPGANDNASGAAALLETARVLRALQRAGVWRPRRGVRFLWMPEFTGTAGWLALDRSHATRVRAALNLDMVGADQARCGSTLLLERAPCFLGSFAEPLLERIRHAAQDWVTSFSGPGHYSMMRMADVPYSGGSDHAVLLDPHVGIPCPMLIQWPDRFYHASSDTPDKCDPASLALAVRCAATYAGTLAALDHEGLEALGSIVALDARRRFLGAGFEPAPRTAMARERLRGRRAIASLAGLGAAPETVADSLGRFDLFCSHEGGARGAGDDPFAEPPVPSPVPRRRAAGPLEFLRHLWPAHESLADDARAALHALLDRVPGERGTLDVAWLACDGKRSLAEIAHVVALETGVHLVPGRAEPSEAPGWHDVFSALETAGLVHFGAGSEPAWGFEPGEAAPAADPSGFTRR